MHNNPPRIATLDDVRRIGQGPYADFMPHRRVLEALEAVALRQPDRTALTGIDLPDPGAPVRRWTHAQLVADIRRAANLFQRLSDGRTPRVALLLPPLPETHLALWGAETAGIACPLNFQLSHGHIAALIQAVDADILVALGPAPDLDIDAKVEQILNDCPGLRHVLRVSAGPGIALGTGQRDFVAELQQQDGAHLGFEVPAGDTAALFHTGGTTGGTTGAPKLARHTHANQLHAA